MKNIVNTALIAASVLSLVACGHRDKAKKPVDSISTNVKIDSTTKTTTLIDSTVKDTPQKASAQVPAPKHRHSSGSGSTSLRAVEDSFKKDSAKLSRK